MKRILLSAVTLLSVSLSAQVGINTTAPEATLDVNGDMKVSTNNGASDQTDALTVLENGKVGVNIKDFKTNSDNEAVLQVGGLIQSSTIRSADEPDADKVVVVDDMGVLKTIKKSNLDYGDDIGKLKTGLDELGLSVNNKEGRLTDEIKKLTKRLATLEEKTKQNNVVSVGTCAKNSVRRGVVVHAQGLEIIHPSSSTICACLDPNQYYVTGFGSCE